MIISLDLIDIY